MRAQLQLLVIFGKSQLQKMNSQLQLHKSQLLEAQLHKNLTAGAAVVAVQELLKIWRLVKFRRNGKIWKLGRTGKTGKIWDLDCPSLNLTKEKREDF